MDINRKLIKPLISLVLVFVLMLLSVLTYFSQSFGWFSANKDADANGQSVHLTSQQASASYTTYSYNARYEELIVDGGSAATGAEDIFMELSPFDTIFRARNKYTAGIIQVTLYDIMEDYLSGGTVSITIKKDTSFSAVVNGQLGNYASNLLKFLPLTRRTHENTVLNATTNKNLNQSNPQLPELFESVYNYVTNTQNQSYSFISGSADNYTELNEITMQVPYSAQDLVNNQFTFYIYVFYNESSISALPSGISGTAVIGQIDDISDNIDLIKISLS